LLRTGVPGGGAPPRARIAHKLYGRKWAELTGPQRRRVRAAESHAYRWINRHGIQAVFSTDCQKIVRMAGETQHAPCASCLSLRTVKSFKNALRVSLPDEANRKFVPHAYREIELGDIYLQYHGLAELVKSVRDININHTGRMLSQFARGVLSGLYAKQEVLLSAIQTTIETKRREAQGKSMRGMRYPTAFDNVCAI
ncbi:hypothetical protein AURDEDRAFT_27661, partial [Auricularia subglabra TFB-10046 SS5]